MLSGRDPPGGARQADLDDLQAKIREPALSGLIRRFSAPLAAVFERYARLDEGDVSLAQRLTSAERLSSEASELAEAEAADARCDFGMGWAGFAQFCRDIGIGAILEPQQQREIYAASIKPVDVTTLSISYLGFRSDAGETGTFRRPRGARRTGCRRATLRRRSFGAACWGTRRSTTRTT